MLSVMLYGHGPRVRLPALFRLAAVLFLFASTFLGEVRECYSLFPFWDSLLHFSAGFMSAVIGFSVMKELADVKSAGLLILFAVCFSMTAAVLWEFYEFTVDTVFFTDMQKDTFVDTVSSMQLGKEKIAVKSASINGKSLEGWLDIGLIDTMKDLFVNAAGAACFSVCGWSHLNGGKAGGLVRLFPSLHRRRSGSRK
jgi:hypothetical protein